MSIKDKKYISATIIFFTLNILTGKSISIISNYGYIAKQQNNLFLISLMFIGIIIIPVILITIIFAYKYNKSLKNLYTPEWDKSIILEVLIWIVPSFIILVLSTVTFTSTKLLDPYNEFNYLDNKKKNSLYKTDPIVIEVISLDWKWLFIYPKYGFASLNEISLPVNKPIKFKLTSSSVMNSFNIPGIIGQIYIMSGMQTVLNCVINYCDTYYGFSSNYSGSGFSGMKFKLHTLNIKNFQKLINRFVLSNRYLSKKEYLNIENPCEIFYNYDYYSTLPNIFNMILNRCVENNSICMNNIMKIDVSKKI